MVIKINLDEDHLKLISNIRFEELSLRTKFSTEKISIAINTLVDKKKKSLKEGYFELVDARDKIQEYSDNAERIEYGIDTYSLYGGSYLLEDLSYILGTYDKHIEGTEFDPEGVRFPEDIETYMMDHHQYIMDNLKYIMTLVFQFINKGGLVPGEYKCKSNELIWSKVE